MWGRGWGGIEGWGWGLSECRGGSGGLGRIPIYTVAPSSQAVPPWREVTLWGDSYGGAPPRGSVCDGRLHPPQADPTANLTFNLRLSDTERQARDGLLLPFHFTAQK